MVEELFDDPESENEFYLDEDEDEEAISSWEDEGGGSWSDTIDREED